MQKIQISFMQKLIIYTPYGSLLYSILAQVCEYSECRLFNLESVRMYRVCLLFTPGSSANVAYIFKFRSECNFQRRVRHTQLQILHRGTYKYDGLAKRRIRE